MPNKTEAELAATEKGRAFQKISPMHAMRLFEEMERMMDSLFPRSWLHPFLWECPLMDELMLPFEGNLPRVEIKVA